MTTTNLQMNNILVNIPDSLRTSLLERFNEIARNFRERRWEPSELNAGKFCEVVYTILFGYINGTYPSAPKKPKNFVDACRSLEQAPASAFSRSIRIQIPRILVALYEIRNNRGVAHVGGDVDPNHMDSIAVLYMSKWVLAELMRVFHGVSCEEATSIVEGIIERVIPVIWKVNDSKYRVLNPQMTMKQKTLVLLYHNPAGVHEKELASWLKISNLPAYRRDVLRVLHDRCMIEFDEQERVAIISPLGVRHVEEEIDLKI